MKYNKFAEWNEIGNDRRPVDYRYVGLDGRPVERTPRSHPYSYDEFVLFKAVDFNEMDSWVYSDRMLQQNSKAFKDAVHEVWPEKSGSQMFYDRKPEDLTRFLSLYFGKKVKLTAVLRGCNVSNGYPYWIFAYREE